METDLLRAELERLFELDELLSFSRELLGFDPDAVGGTAAVGSFARALAEHCVTNDAVEALCDALVASKSGVSPDVATLGMKGLLVKDELALGDRLGPFLIARKLGESAAGISYAARIDDGEVRLKVLRAEAVRDQRALRRFLTMTRLASRVRHQGLPWKLRVGFVDDRHYVAHDVVEGQSLASRIARTGAMHLNEARDLVRSLLQALAALHAARLVHGNLKSENVILHRTEDGALRAVLLDACGDRLRARPKANGHVEPWTVSSPKTVAPEQLRGRPATPATDVYAFGAVLFELLTGKAPFETKTIADALVAHLSEKPRLPSQVAPRGFVSRDLDAFVLSLLEKDPLARPQTADAVLSALDALGRPAEVAAAAPAITDEDLAARIDAVIAAPESEDAALALESAVSDGATAARVAETFLMAAEQLEGAEEPEKRSTAIGLLFRAGRLLQDAAANPEGAERAYQKIVQLDPEDGAAAARLDAIRRKLGKWDELVESLLARAERAAPGAERALVLGEIGALYANDVGDREQALVAFTQALCEDPVTDAHAEDVERLAGTDVASWGEVLAACNEASTGDAPPEVKNALFSRMAAWYETRYSRPDLALQCLQAILATDPSNEKAAVALSALYRKAQQWPELGTLLLRRADAAADPGKARELRFEAAQLLETQLNDVGAAREIYGSILGADPGHTRSREALLRIFDQAGDFPNAVKLLEMQAATERGDDLRRTLCRIAEIHEDRLKDDAEAIRRYSAVLDEDPTHIDALRGLDRLYSKAGRFADLLENLGQQIQAATTPRQKITLWERVAAVHDEEFLDHQKAAFALERLLELSPEHDGALTGLARHYRALDRWEDLALLYEKHLALLTDTGRRLEVAFARAKVLAENLASTERAIAAYEQVLAIDPTHGAALEALARLRETAGHEDAALAAIDALIAKAESPEARSELLVRAAKLSEGRGDRDGAILRYKQALDATPKNTAVASALRDAYVARGDVNAAVELIEREIDGAEGESQKAKLYSELATLQRERLRDDVRAEKAARKALELDPTDVPATTLVADVAFEAGRFVEAAAFYEKLAGRTEMLTKDAAVRVLERYVDALAKGGSTEKALVAMDTLLRLAPDDVAAVSRVASVTFEHGSPGRAVELYTDLLERFGDGLSTADRAVATYRLGEASRRVGKLAEAVTALENAADLDPSSPLPLLALSAVHEAREDWAKVVDAKSRHLDLATGEERLGLLVDIGEIAAAKLQDRPLATKNLVAALDERPDDRKLLARLMQLYSEDKDWQKLVDVVLKLADFVDDPRQKAKYLLTAAMVTGREMREYDQAIGYYDRVLSMDPGNEKATDEAIELLEEKGDYAGAVERLKEKAKRASEAKDAARMLAAFEKLAPLYRDKLGRIGHAVDAMEAAQTVDPDNQERSRALAEIYAAYPERYLEKAVQAQMKLLHQNPYRVESYKLLRRLYTEDKRADAAWCLCQALYVLKLAEPDEERFFRRMRAEDPAYAQAIMTADDWLELVFHADADPMLTSLFALIEPAMIATRNPPLEAHGYDPRFAVDPSQHPYPVSQTLHYAAGVMGMSLPVVFENQNDPGGLGFLHAATPGIVLGSGALLADASPQALAFLAARHLAYFRPGLYVRQLVQSVTGLRSWLFAAIKMNAPQFPVPPDIEGPVREALAALERHLGPQLRDHLSRVVSKLIQSGAALDLKKWIQGVDLTADRIGFVLCHDLETAVEIIRASDESSSALLPQARLKDLVLYGISDPYFKLRERLKIGVDV
ncbi:MAG TPA: protein kinase [Polyangiaceae bacterium]|nr:protein kinase [Polyangiaceae bacterium]